MRILIIGSGGREHAIIRALKKTSVQSLELYCAPGNAGTAIDATNVPISMADIPGLAQFAETQPIDLTFVGPEAPLAAGIVDAFQSRNLRIVGPTSAAARLEASKAFAKDFMARHAVPTAIYRVAETPQQALGLLRAGIFGPSDSAVVIKADGLAAGKGVVVAANHQEASRAVEELMVNHVAGADAASRVVLEEALIGVEASLLLFSDGKDYVTMPAARDHKRIGENDTGPNTGGMGSITDAAILPETQLKRVIREVVEPTLMGADSEGFQFKGVLFLGLMLTSDGPKLLEYNVRFGDPETQAILMRMDTDLAAIFDSMHTGTLGELKVEWAAGSSACVVAANRGYPGKYDTGAVIEGLDQKPPEGVEIFHAGTSLSSDGKITATGGRVLGVAAASPSLTEALSKCYAALGTIHWLGMQYRRDIGQARGV